MRRGALGAGLLVAALAGGAFLLLTQHEPAPPEAPAPERPTPAAAGPAAGPGLEGRASPRPPAPAAPSDADPLPAPPPEAADTLVLLGRVVDERRRPAPGAAVLARVDTYAEVGVRTDAAGRFRLPLGAPPARLTQGVVHVRGPGGSAVLRAAWVGARGAPREIDLGVLTLRPGGGLRVRVERDGAPVPAARVAVRRAGAWALDLAALAASDARGEVHVPALPAGPYRLAALAEGHGRAVQEVVVQPGQVTEVRLALAAERVVTVQVVAAATDAPVAGAQVTLRELLATAGGRMEAAFDPPLEVPVGDAEGRTRLRGLAAGDRPLLRATAPGYPDPAAGRFGMEDRYVTLAADATEVRLVLDPLVPLRWPLTPGDPLAPPEGARLPLEADPSGVGATLPPEVRVEGGYLVAEGFSKGPIQAFARAPDGVYGRLLRLPTEPDGRAVTFTRERRLDVRVRTPEGAPATGVYVSARSQGNNPLGAPTLVDAEGRAVLRLMHPYLVEVYASRTNQPWTGTALGTADLRQGDASVEGSVLSEREVLLAVRLDGRPGLPGEFTVNLGPAQATVLEEDPEAGTLRLRVAVPPSAPSGQSPSLGMRAPGFAPASADLLAGEGAGPLRATLDLAPAGVLRVRVKPPADGRAGRVLVQRFDPARRVWTQAIGDGMPLRRPGAGGPDAPQTYPDLVAGRYRAVALDAGEVSPEVEVAGGAEAEVLLDLARSGDVTGTVEVPEGFDVRQTTLQADLGELGDLFGAAPGRSSPRADGTFVLRVAGTRAVPLIVRHPLLAPDPASARVVLEGPQTGLRLRLVQGALLRFTLPSDAAPRPGPPGMPPPPASGVRVLLFRGAPAGTPLHSVDAQHDGEAWVAGGYEPGTYTLWLDPLAGPPLLRPDVVLGPGATDLGALDPGPGSRLRVRVKGREGTAVPRLSVWAVHQGEPPYQRGTNSPGGEGDVLVTGLGPGRFRVTAAPVMGVLGVGGDGRGFRIDQVVEVDGTNEVVLDLDLR